MAADYFLDCDAKGLRSRIITCSAAGARSRAIAMLYDVIQGRIAIYRGGPCGDFLGYAIKRIGQLPYFEPAEADDEAA